MYPIQFNMHKYKIMMIVAFLEIKKVRKIKQNINK